MEGKEWIEEAPGRFEVKRELGNGYFATVYEAFDNKLGKTVAVKAVDRRKLNTEYSCVAKIDFEAEVMSELKHKYVCQLLERTDTKTFILLILEFCTNGTLFSEIVSQPQRHLSKKQSRKVFIQMVDCIEYVHAQNVAHRDIKPENILFDNEMNIKLADFGLAFRFDPSETTMESVGSLDYASPEVLLQYPYVGPEPDVWSMGVVLYAMLTGTLPFMGATDEDVFKAIVRGHFRIPRFLGQDVVEIIEACFTLDPHLRPSITELKTFDFLWESFYKDEKDRPAKTPRTARGGTDSSTPMEVGECLTMSPSYILTDEQVKSAHLAMKKSSSVRPSAPFVLSAEPTPRGSTPRKIETIDIDAIDVKVDLESLKQFSTSPRNFSPRISTPTGKTIVSPHSPSRRKKKTARPHSMHLTATEVQKAIMVGGLGEGGVRAPKAKAVKEEVTTKQRKRVENIRKKREKRRTISFGRVVPLITKEEFEEQEEQERLKLASEQKRDSKYHRSLKDKVFGRKKRTKDEKKKRGKKKGSSKNRKGQEEESKKKGSVENNKTRRSELKGKRASMTGSSGKKKRDKGKNKEK